MRRIIFFVFSVCLLFLSTVTYAQNNTVEHIQLFDSQIEIQKNGKIQVTETIEYDFGSEERHGIYRSIPFLKTNTEGKQFRMNIDTQSVKDQNGKNYSFQESTENGELQLKIGDANTTITGLHTYIISYSVDGSLTYFTNHDELYWNVTGNEWNVPIEKASASIYIQNVAEDQLTADCYTGVMGSNTSTCISEIMDSRVVFSTNTFLNQSEGLTIAVTFPKNIVSVLEPTEVVSFFDTLMGKIVLMLLIVLGVFWYIIYPLYLPLKWYLQGRDPFNQNGKVQALFESPKTKTGRHLTPAETGTLIDEHAGPREISALLVDLARRGYLTIIENKKNDFSLEQGKEFTEDTTLRGFEKTLLKGIFKTGKKTQLKEAKLYETVQKVQDELYHSLVHEGYFPEHPEKVRSFYMGILAAASITFNFFLILTASIFGRIMPKKTLEGVQVANLTRSLRNFLSSQERQLEFQAKNQLFFEKLLPFAVAFGVEKVWADRFKDINMQQPDWYVSSTANSAFSANTFTRSLNSSFFSFNSAANPPTSSSGFSSGSGGGGSSGGGGGGGGGGSW